MKRGTLLGAFMILTNIFYLLGLKTALFSTLFLLCFVGTPLLAGRLAVLYRKKERENRLKFVEAWLFLMIMYACASALTAVAQYTYFVFIDNGYFFEFLQEQFNTFLSLEGMDAAMQEQVATTAELLKKLTARDLVLQILGTGLMFSPIITGLTAIFVQRK